MLKKKKFERKLESYVIINQTFLKEKKEKNEYSINKIRFSNLENKNINKYYNII